jgi:hypothetical protein
MSFVETAIIWLTSSWFAAIIFVIALVALHISLVFRNPLTKVGWKYVDYLWLSFGALGLLGASTQSREVAVGAYISFFDGYNEAIGDPVQKIVTSSVVLFCVGPTQGYTEDVKGSYEEACNWFKTIPRIEEPRTAWLPIARNQYPNRPVTIDRVVTSALRKFDEAVESHNEWVQHRSGLKQTTEKSRAEYILGLLSPILLAIAFALRITKVTGEIRLG